MAAWWHDIALVAGARLRHPGLEATHHDRWAALQAAARLLESEHAPDRRAGHLSRERVRSSAERLHPARGRRATGSAPGSGSCRRTRGLPAPLGRTSCCGRLERRTTRGRAPSPPSSPERWRSRGRTPPPGSFRQTEFLEHARRWSFQCRRALRRHDARRPRLRAGAPPGARRGIRIEPRPALAQLPTRTEVGMAALLPRADGQFAVKVEDGKLISYIGTTRLPSVEERKRHYDELSLASKGIASRREEVQEFLKNDGALLAECGGLRARCRSAYTLDIDEGGADRRGRDPVRSSTRSLVALRSVHRSCPQGGIRARWWSAPITASSCATPTPPPGGIPGHGRLCFRGWPAVCVTRPGTGQVAPCAACP